MWCHISNKTAYAGEVQVTAEVVKTPTVAENATKKADGGDNVADSSGPVEVVEKKKGSESYSHTPTTSEDEEDRRTS